MILETLTDLLAEPALLSDLFYNYDCDTQRTDVLESLVRALADCCKVRASRPPSSPSTSSASTLSFPLPCLFPSTLAPELDATNLFSPSSPSLSPSPSSSQIIDPDALAMALASTGSSSSSSSSSLTSSSSLLDAPLRIALPGGEDLEHTHMLREHCMDALLQLLRQLYLRCEDSYPYPSSSSSSSSSPSPSPPPLGPHGPSTDAWERKKWKRVLQHGAALFNKKPRLGLQYLGRLSLGLGG